MGGDDCLVAGRDPARADRLVDLREPGAASYRTALTNVDVVVNAAGIENPALAAIAAEHGAAFVDITATSGYVAALERLRPPRPVLVSVGLAPGLTNLLAVAVHDSEPGPIAIALLVGAGERHGAAATAWSYGLLGKRFRDPTGGWFATTLGRAALTCPVRAGGDCTGPTLPTSTRSVATSPCRCAPTSASTPDWRPRCLPA